MRKTGILCLLLLGVTACFNLNKISLYDLSDQYSNTTFTSVQAVALNQDGTARIFLPLNLTDFAAKEDEESGRTYVKAKVSHSLFATYESKEILDSASTTVIDSSLQIMDTTLLLQVNYPSTGLFVLRLQVTDLNRVDEVSTFLMLDNRDPGSRNNFLVRYTGGELLYDTYIEAGDRVDLFYNGRGEGLFVRYYKRDFPLALPPFIDDEEYRFNFRADSMFYLGLDSDGYCRNISLPGTGIYHFQPDTNRQSGFTLFRYPGGFPSVSTPDQLLKPLRYITTKKEYADLEEAGDRKLAIDNYWLANSGNPARARAMIQKYYMRVAEANTHFSSYHEGWKTDRGIIYIVYGPPGIVYRGDGIEEWLYGEKGNANSMRFRFARVQNPFTENDYSLIKSPSYKERWYNIVNSWRR